MNAVTVPVVIGEDRRLVIELPDSTPVGPAEVDVIIRPRADGAARVDDPEVVNPAREAARAKLLAAGVLNTSIHAPVGTVPVSDEELERLGQLSPGARPSEELVDEDRGLY